MFHKQDNYAEERKLSKKKEWLGWAGNRGEEGDPQASRKTLRYGETFSRVTLLYCFAHRNFSIGRRAREFRVLLGRAAGGGRWRRRERGGKKEYWEISIAKVLGLGV